MTIYYNGTLTVVDKSGINVSSENIRKALGTSLDSSYFDTGVVTFEDELMGGNFIEDFVCEAKKREWVVNGSVDYYGDYEGRLVVADNQVTDMDIDSAIIADASDEALISELKQRGYEILPKMCGYNFITACFDDLKRQEEIG